MTAQLLGEAFLVGCITGVGASTLRLGLPRVGYPLIFMFSGLVGVLLVAMTSVVVLGLGGSNHILTVVILSVALLAASLVIDARQSRLGRGLVAIGGAALVGASATLGIGLLVAPILTFDSWRFLEFGSSTFGDGASVQLLLEQYLGNYPIALTSLEGLARGLGLPFLASGVAAVGIMGVAGAFDLFGRRLVGPRAGLRLFLLVVAVIGIAASAYMTRLQLGYINSHAMTAGFFSIGVAALFAPGNEGSPLSPVDERLRAVLLGISCAGLALGRVEGLLLVGLMLVAAVTYRGWSRRSLGVVALIGVVVPAIWYGRLATTVIDADILSPSRMVMLLLVATAPLLVAIISEPGHPIPWLASMTLFFLGAATLLVALTNPAGMGTSVSHLFLNLASTGLWGAVWWVVIPLFVMSVSKLHQTNEKSGWLVLTFGYVLIVLLLGGIRDVPYAARWGDSGNRMMVHVLPAFFLLIFSAFGQADEGTNVVARKREAV